MSLSELFAGGGNSSSKTMGPSLLYAAVVLVGAAVTKAAYTMLSRPKPYPPCSDGEGGGESRTTMRRLVVVEPNREDLTKVKMSVEEVPIPQPKWGEVLVRVAAAPINPSDYGEWRQRKGPTGHEGCGVAVGSGGGFFANRLVGKKVGVIVGRARTCSEFVCCDAAREVTSLQSIGDVETAASWFVNPVTAISMLETARNEHGAGVLIHTAAASQLGQMLLKLVRIPSSPYYEGMTVVNVVRRQEQAELLRSEPFRAEYVICTADENWRDRLKSTVDELGARIAFDAVGGSMTGALVSVLPPGGICYAYGVLSGPTVGDIPTIDLIYRNKQVRGYHVGKNWLSSSKNPLTSYRRFAAAVRAVSEGLKRRDDGAEGWAESKFVDCTMDDAHETFCRLRERGVTGKKLRVLMNPGSNSKERKDGAEKKRNL